jgi:hypothetical protein
MSRQTLAFIVAPLWVPVLVALYAFYYSLFPDFGRTVFVAIPVGVSAAISYGSTLILGRPAFAFLRAHKMTSVWMAVATGFAVGSMTPIAFLTLIGAMPVLAFFLANGASQSGVSLLLVASAAMGALVGLTFWLIARPDRPVAGRR